MHPISCAVTHRVDRIDELVGYAASCSAVHMNVLRCAANPPYDLGQNTEV